MLVYPEMKTALHCLAWLCLSLSLTAEVAFVTTATDGKVLRVGSSGAISDFAPDLGSPRGVVFDDAGNAFVSDFSGGTVLKLPAGGGAAVTMASGLNGPTGLALGDDGALYAAVSGGATVIKITAPAAFTTFATLATGANPQGIAFSPDGDLHTANKGTNTISKITPAGSISTFSDDVTAPTGVAFDSSGKIFAIHGGTSGVIARFNPGGKATNHVTGFNDPRALVMDRDDNFYVVNGGDNSLKCVTPAKAVSTLAPSLASPQGVAVRGPKLSLVATRNETLTTDPAGAKFSILGQPAIAAGGTAAYRATLLAGISGVAATNAAGIWRDNAGGVRERIARASFAAPGTTDAVFATFSDPVINSAGNVAFRATLRGGVGDATPGKTIGIWTDTSGIHAIAARQGDQPGGVMGVAKFVAFTALTLPDSGGPVFQATIAGLGITAANNTGLWVAPPGGGTQLLLRKGDTITVDAAPLKVLAFVVLKPVVFALGAARSVAADGGVTILATFSDRTTAILRLRGGMLSVVARKGHVLTTTPVGGKLAALFSPAIAATGDVAWRGALTANIAGVTAASAKCLFHDTAVGARTLIARAAFPAPGTSGSVFAAFADPIINSAGSVAFRATLKPGIGDAVTGTTIGLWSNGHGPLTVAARQGARPPGLGNGTKFIAFNSYVLPDAGGLVTLATVAGSGITTVNNQGIWAVDGDGTLQRIVQKGDKLDINGTQKTVTALKLFLTLPYGAVMGRNYATDGGIAFIANFSDLTHAILRVSFP